ncbi:MAG TPA: BON domain-containing protein [Terriglobia bacterium]|nr:BON domain-containing protein [Terriglobia bacterium]
MDQAMSWGAWRTVVLIVSAAVALAACNAAHISEKPQAAKSADDTTITNSVEAALFKDPTLKQRTIDVASQGGVVMLTGTVDSNIEKLAAERLVTEMAGVRGVADHLTVASPGPAAASSVTSAPELPARVAQEHRARSAYRREKETAVAKAQLPVAHPLSTMRATVAPTHVAQITSPKRAAAASVRIPPPPPPVVVPAGLQVHLRTIVSIDSKHSQPGQQFRASLQSPVVVGPKLVFPQGTDARVRLVGVKQAGRFTGSTVLRLQLASITFNGVTYQTQSGYYNVHTAPRGKRTAETVGGGAGLGALIGAIAGHGKGAAIGAGVGAVSSQHWMRRHSARHWSGSRCSRRSEGMGFLLPWIPGTSRFRPRAATRARPPSPSMRATLVSLCGLDSTAFS